MQLPLCKGDERKNSYSAKSGHIRSLHAPHPSPWHHSTEKGFKCHRETACICIFILSSARAKAYKFRALRYATSAIEQDELFSYLLSFRKKKLRSYEENGKKRSDMMYISYDLSFAQQKNIVFLVLQRQCTQNAFRIAREKKVNNKI